MRPLNARGIFFAFALLALWPVHAGAAVSAPSGVDESGADQNDTTLPAGASWDALKDLRGERRGPWRVPWAWIAAACAAALCAAWLYRRSLNPGAAAPPLPAHVVADIEIDKLLRENLIDRGEAPRFVARLSDILRRYIESRFSMRAPERTTEEFYAELKTSSRLDGRLKAGLIEFLRRADMVKFAAETVSREGAMELLDAARQFIRQTREIETVRGGRSRDASGREARAA